VVALRRRYPELRLPIYIVAGERDRYVNSHFHSGRLHELVAGSRLRLTPGAGHMLHHVAPRDVMSAVEAAAGPVPA
jgi:pimeloyl-ACP methyl ester carboxylesterase